MFRFPFSFPSYPYNYPYYKYYNKKYNYNNVPPQTQSKEPEKKENSITNSNEISNTINSRSWSNSEQQVFELFNIKLYFDDLIILGILFFLYQQDVKDEMLYIILFLLLFS